MAGRIEGAVRRERLGRAATRPLAAALVAVLALSLYGASPGRGSASAPAPDTCVGNEMDRPVSESALPSFEELQARMLKLFVEAPFAWTDIHPERNPVSVDLFPRGRDIEAWKLLVEGVRRARPGLAVTAPPRIVLQCGFSMGDGSCENRLVMYKDGMLCSPRPYFGGMVSTLKVGPEFEQGLRLLEKVPGIDLEWSTPPTDERPEEMAAAKVSREEAVRIAQRFAAEIGLPLGDAPQAVYRAAKSPYPPRWEVSNHDFALVAVAADDGSVTLAENRSAREQNWHIAGAVEVTEEQAPERATAALWLMGARPDEVHLDRVKLQHYEGAARGTWLVYWNRATDGIPYRDDEAHVVLDATSGTIFYATKRWFSAPPATTETKIGKERAREIALGLAEAIGTREIIGIKDEPALRIVQPNYRHSTSHEERQPEYQGPTRVAWEVMALLPASMPGHRVRQEVLWIDAVTGELLGGYGFRGSAAPKEISQGAPEGTSSEGERAGEKSALPMAAAVGGGGAAAAVLALVLLGRSRAARKSRRIDARAE